VSETYEILRSNVLIRNQQGGCVHVLDLHPNSLLTNEKELQTLIAAANREEALTRRVEELEAIVAKLPKTADGVPIVPGMHVWFYSKRSCSQWVEELKVTGWEHLPGMEPGWMFVLSVVNEHGDTDGVNLECSYSTEAAALAAKGVQS
jgi:hypothetical protein